MASPETKVYRLRGIPAHLDRLGVAQLIQPFLPDGKLEDVTVASLALSCDFWVRNPTKTATICLRKLPKAVCAAPTAGEWQLPVLALPRPLVLDDTFYGLTPLNEVAESKHQHDCIVISGLASHPMGSWQPRGNDKSFMWIRDALPDLVPSVRFILYGYDTKLVGSKSFQTVADLANNLINELKTGGWATPSSKPLTFLAHSLGGVVLKQCLYMLADSEAAHESMLEKTKGAIFFGVPSEGMDIKDITSMLGNQPNKEALVDEISSGSTFLSSLEERISGISIIQGMKSFWAYETQATPTLELVNGTYRRSGPDTLLVSRRSATGNRYLSDSASTIQIDANHSNMVKLSSGSHMIGPIANKLRDILGHDQHDLDRGLEYSAPRNLPVISSAAEAATKDISSDTRDASQDLGFWDLDSIITSLRAPERDERLEQIDKNAGCSFEWVFEDPSIGLKNWLQKGDGLYWVSGRPASGKSTFMKFLYHNKDTSQLLRGWYSKGEHVEVNFFFHHRGSLIQKSFEGLLRSILSQILEQAPGTFSIIQSLLPHRSQNLSTGQSSVNKGSKTAGIAMDRYSNSEQARQSAEDEEWTLQNLEKALLQIIDQQLIDLDLCLFIDALDEHDGPPEFIAEFLKDITGPRNSRTRLKILFSSRPWDAFTDAFHNCPGFRIHEHTENDIRELCYKVIESECPGSQELLQLVEEIVKRARGVFLWAKLVLQDLSKIAAAARPEVDTEALTHELKGALENLPDDLIKYYSTIVERIPQSFRREAFCLLEVVAKGEEINLVDVPKILSCLKFSKFSERDQLLEDLDEPSLEHLAILLRTYTGGLIEIHGGLSKLQLLHQTTVDFIQLPEFKNIILRSGAHAINDNGHTFLVKLVLLKFPGQEYGSSPRREDFLRHANCSEKTTGRSLYSFFSDGSASKTHGQYLYTRREEHPDYLHTLGSTVQMAFGGHLRLFIKDALQVEPSILSQAVDCCAEIVAHALMRRRFTQEEAIHMIDILAAHDFQFENHANCLAYTLILIRDSYSFYKSYDALMLNIIKRFKNLDIIVHFPVKATEVESTREVAKTTYIIHLCSYSMTKYLLQEKANPNLVDCQGRTPLDCYVMGLNYSDEYGDEELHRLMTLLAQNGGLLNKCTEKDWWERMLSFQQSKLDVSLFEQLEFPRWINKPEGKFFRRIIGTKLVNMWKKTHVTK